MKIKVSHQNIYEYDSQVFLESHTIRLCPRNEPSQMINSFEIEIEPKPVCQTQYLDTEGNIIIQAWFSELTNSLKITTNFEVETHRANPFDFYTDPIDLKFPFKYQSSEALHPYLKKQTLKAASLKDFIDDLEQKSNGNIFTFLTFLNQQINQLCKYKIREDGAPYSPDKTFSIKEGSCRDVAVLFIEVCRQKGIAARFVSGYRYSETNQEDYHLHAWAEAFIPGGGWRGFDPTEGIAIDENYITLVASFAPQNTLPIAGTTRSKNAASTFISKITLDQND